MKYIAGCFVTCEVTANSHEEAINAAWNKFESLGIGSNGPIFYGYEVNVEEVKECGD